MEYPTTCDPLALFAMAAVLVLQLIHIWVSGKTHRHTAKLVRSCTLPPQTRSSDGGAYSRRGTSEQMSGGDSDRGDPRV